MEDVLAAPTTPRLTSVCFPPACLNRLQAQVDKLDFAMRKKSSEDANKALAATKASLDAVLAKLA